MDPLVLGDVYNAIAKAVPIMPPDFKTLILQVIPMSHHMNVNIIMPLLMCLTARDLSQKEMKRKGLKRLNQ